jgi:uncharacterized membrane protein YgcG
MPENAIKEKYLKGNNFKLQMAKLAAVLMIITALFLSWPGSDAPENNPSRTVYDGSEMLSDDTVGVIESRNSALIELTGSKKAKIIVVVEKGRTSYKDLEKKADKAFKDYKAGDNDILFVAAVPDSKSHGWGDKISDFFSDLFGGGTQPYAYHTGRNLGDSAEITIDAIFMEYFEINYEDGNYNAAVSETFNSLADYFDEYYQVDSKNYETGITENYNVPPQGSPAAVIIGLIFLFGILLIILGVFTGKKNPGVSRVYKNPFWFGII